MRAHRLFIVGRSEHSDLRHLTFCRIHTGNALMAFIPLIWRIWR